MPRDYREELKNLLEPEPVRDQVPLPVRTRVQTLPLHELSWENFERLCARLVASGHDIVDCHRYGVRGDAQGGVDIMAYRERSGGGQREFLCYQCKRWQRMTPDKDTPRLLGAAFLIQAVASAVSGLFLLQPLIVPGSIVDSMTNIANHALQMRASIVVEMITAIGIVMLGGMLYVTVKNQNAKIALVALGLYLMEATLLAASRMPAFSLLHISQASVAAGHPADFQALGSLYY